MRTSEAINELAAALAKAQGEIEGAHKDAANPFFKSRYADLASVWDACRVPLSRHGLSIVQLPRAEGNVVTMETRLLHSSGQWIEGELTAVAKDDGPQSIGSIVTYLRRYMLQAVTGVAPEDDDGNAAQGSEPRQQAERIAKQHGMTTGDKVPPPTNPKGPPEVPMYDQLKAKLDTLKSDDPDVRAKIETAVEFIELQAKKGTITKPQQSELAFMVMEIQKEVDSLQAA